MRGALALLVAALLSGGCSKAAEPTPPPRADAAAATADAGDAAAPLDPVTAAVHRAAACKADAACLDRELADKVFDQGGGASVLVSLLEDRDAAVREAAAIRLDRHAGKGYATDKTLAPRMVAVGEKPRLGSNVFFQHLGAAIGRIKVREADTWLRVRGLMEKGAGMLRRSILSTVLEANGGDEDVQKAVRARLHDVDPAVRVAAASALEKTTDGVCKLLAQDLASTDDADVGRAGQALMLDMSRCPAQHAGVLAAIERVQNAGKMKSPDATAALVPMLTHKDEATRRRALALARSIVQDRRAPGAVRRVLLAPLVADDPKAMAPILAKLAKEPDPVLITALEALDAGAPEAGAPEAGAPDGG